MKREHVAELYTAYLDGSLPEQIRQEMDAHLQDCPQCATELADLRVMLTCLQELPAATAPDDLAARVRARLPGHRRKPALVWRVPALVGGLLSATALAVLLLARSSIGPYRTDVAGVPSRPSLEQKTLNTGAGSRGRTSLTPPVIPAPLDAPQTDAHVNELFTPSTGETRGNVSGDSRQAKKFDGKDRVTAASPGNDKEKMLMAAVPGIRVEVVLDAPELVTGRMTTRDDDGDATRVAPRLGMSNVMADTMATPPETQPSGKAGTTTGTPPTEAAPVTVANVTDGARGAGGAAGPPGAKDESGDAGKPPSAPEKEPTVRPETNERQTMTYGTAGLKTGGEFFGNDAYSSLESGPHALRGAFGMLTAEARPPVPAQSGQVLLRLAGNDQPAGLDLRFMLPPDQVTHHVDIPAKAAREILLRLPAMREGGAVKLTLQGGGRTEGYYLVLPGDGPRRVTIVLQTPRQPMTQTLVSLAGAAGVYILCPADFAEQVKALSAPMSTPLNALATLAGQSRHQVGLAQSVVYIAPVR